MSDPSNNNVAPDPQGTQQTLTDGANANATITAYAHALQNCIITPIEGHLDWYKTFNNDLKQAQEHAKVWVDTLGPLVFAQVPQSIINYGNTFSTATDNIISILSSLPPSKAPTSDQQQQINDLINALLVVLLDEKTKILDVHKQLQEFATNIHNDHTSLLEGQNSARQQVQLEQKQVDLINAQINKIKAQLQTDNTSATASEIGLGVAIFITVAAIGLAVATAGAAAPLIAVGIGVIGVGASIAGTVIFSEKVKADIEELYKQQAALSDEERQVCALQGITESIQSLVTQNEAATKAVSNVLDTWAVLETKLQSVLDDLQKAEASHVPAIIEKLDLQTARKAWDQLVAFADRMQRTEIRVTQPDATTTYPPKVA